MIKTGAQKPVRNSRALYFVAPTPKLTAAEVRALVAVAAGNVVRVYRTNGNTLHGPRGVGSATLRRLDDKRLIADGGHYRSMKCTQTITAAGKAALDAATKGQPDNE